MHISSTCMTTLTVATTLLMSSTWIDSASANVIFARFAPNTSLRAGETFALNWTVSNVNIVAPNNEPFDLELRALSGQRYKIQDAVPQDRLTLQVTIPKEATGGPHSFYAEYNDATRNSSNQFTVPGPVVTTPVSPATPTGGGTSGGGTTTGAPQSNNDSSGGGLSGAALGGVIGGVVVVLVATALVFFVRHRRLVRERSQHSRLDDTKETYSETHSARSGPPPGPSSGASFGGKEDGMVAIPLSGAPGAPYPPGGPGPLSPPPPTAGSPRSRNQPPYQIGHSNDGNRNPFDGPEEMMAAAAAHGGAGPNLSHSPRQQHQPYQPPQHSPQPPRPHQPTAANPFQLQGRDSYESEPESAYDPNHPRVLANNMSGQPPINRNNSNPMMRGGPGAQQLSHSASSKSLGSEFRQSPRMPHQQPLHPQPQSQNPFQDRELMAAAGGIAHNSNSPRLANQNVGQSPLIRSATPRTREIEMQPLDVQQHQYEQQQRALQRQQQQQQATPQPSSAATPAPAAPAAPTAPGHPFNPTLYDDKTEVDEDGAPVYNGYRDTIFGAYAQPAGDDDDDDEEDGAKKNPVPALPTSALAGTHSDKPTEGGVTRKKSVKFTGVPLSGPIDTTTTGPGKIQSQLYHSEGDDEDDEDEDVKLRLLETEASNTAAAYVRPPGINTASHSQASSLSPVHSPDASNGFIPPPPMASANTISSLDPSPLSPLGDGFYEDVLAAVDKTAHTPTSPTQKQHPAVLTPQLQHLQPVLSEKQVFGAPSPRMKASAPTGQHSQQLPAQITTGGYPSPPAPSTVKPSLSPRSAARPVATQSKPQQRDDEENQFYEASLL